MTAALNWYHTSIRAGSAKLMFNKVIAQRLVQVSNKVIAQQLGQAGNEEVGNEEVALDALKVLQLSLKQMQFIWLREGASPFMCGDQISVADLLCSCELEQLSMLQKSKHGLDMKEILQPFPAVKRWMQRVSNASGPHYEAVHQVLRKAAGTAMASSKLAPVRGGAPSAKKDCWHCHGPIQAVRTPVGSNCTSSTAVGFKCIRAPLRGGAPSAKKGCWHCHGPIQALPKAVQPQRGRKYSPLPFP
eukprot:gene1468-32850_t